MKERVELIWRRNKFGDTTGSGGTTEMIKWILELWPLAVTVISLSVSQDLIWEQSWSGSSEIFVDLQNLQLTTACNVIVIQNLSEIANSIYFGTLEKWSFDHITVINKWGQYISFAYCVEERLNVLHENVVSDNTDTENYPDSRTFVYIHSAFESGETSPDH